MRITPTLRRLLVATTLMALASSLLVGWQIVAYLHGNIPGHILPLVRLLCGTKEDIPVAFDWTVRLAFLSAGALVCSLVMLGWVSHCIYRAKRPVASTAP